MRKELSLAISLIAIVAIMTETAMYQPAVMAKKHSECFNAGVSDRKDHPFDASRFDRCGKNYQDGFLKGCRSNWK